MNVISYAQIGVTGATVASGTVPGNAYGVVVSCRQASGVLTLDGSVPGGTTGHVIVAGSQPVTVDARPLALKWASSAGSTAATGAAILDVTFLGD